MSGGQKKDGDYGRGHAESTSVQQIRAWLPERG